MRETTLCDNVKWVCLSLTCEERPSFPLPDPKERISRTRFQYDPLQTNRLAKVICNAYIHSGLCTLKSSDIGNPYWEKREAYCNR